MQQLEASQAERDEKTAMAAAQTALLEAKVHVASGLQRELKRLQDEVAGFEKRTSRAEEQRAEAEARSLQALERLRSGTAELEVRAASLSQLQEHAVCRDLPPSAQCMHPSTFHI